MVCLLPEAQRSAPGGAARGGHPGAGGVESGGGHRAEPGRYADRGPPGRVVQAVLPGPEGRTRHRFGIRPAGLLPALLHRRGPGCRPGPDGHAAVAGAAGPVGGAGRGRVPQPDPGSGVDVGWHLSRRRRLHPAAQERDGLHGGVGHCRRRGARRGPLHRTGPLRWTGDRGGDRLGDRLDRDDGAHRRPPAGRGRSTRRHPHPGRRGTPPGGGHRAVSRTRPGLGSRWCST